MGNTTLFFSNRAWLEFQDESLRNIWGVPMFGYTDVANSRFIWFVCQCLLCVWNIFYLHLETFWGGRLSKTIAMPKAMLWFEIRVGCIIRDSNVWSKCWLRFNLIYNDQPHRWMWVLSMPFPETWCIQGITHGPMVCRRLKIQLVTLGRLSDYLFGSTSIFYLSSSLGIKSHFMMFMMFVLSCLTDSNLLSVIHTNWKLAVAIPFRLIPELACKTMFSIVRFPSSNAPRGCTNSLSSIFSYRKIHSSPMKRYLKGMNWRFPFRHRGTPSHHPFRTMGF